MTKIKPVPAPAGLATAGRALWLAVVGQLADDGLVPDQREQAWLALAAREADQLARVEAALVDAPLVVTGSQGQPVANGLLGEATRSRTTIAGLLARLDLSDPLAAATTGRGSRTTSTSARAAALARHRRVS